ncbi:MAG TPA: sensor histidine kinase [Noviherbaspirillum sp.]|nr:sensor histidine kinase [Noviherbaspirillum sp.]
MKPGARSVRAYLLGWIIAPIALFIVIDTFTLYRNALESVNTAYDRMLIATAHSIGDLLRYENGELKVVLPHATLEIYEADRLSRMIYRVEDFGGQFLSGDAALPRYTGARSNEAAYPTVVRIYEDQYRGELVRVAALFQPVMSNDASGGAVVQVAETIDNRRSLAQKILRDTLLRQAVLLLVVAVVTLIVVNHALRPLSVLREQLDQRRADDLSPLLAPSAPKELQPVTNALNSLMGRLQRLLDYQHRFVANASHQLRTPLAVLKTQLQSGLRGDAPAEVVLQEMRGTVERATMLANQLLSLAKVEQLRGRGMRQLCDLTMIARSTALDLSPLIAEKNLDFALDAAPAQVRGHPWMIGELISNLLHNAIRHTPAGAQLGVTVSVESDHVRLCVWDSGAGLPASHDRERFEPFAHAHGSKGGGLGLAICKEIADSMNARITLADRCVDGRKAGAEAVVEFPKG